MNAHRTVVSTVLIFSAYVVLATPAALAGLPSPGLEDCDGSSNIVSAAQDAVGNTDCDGTTTGTELLYGCNPVDPYEYPGDPDCLFWWCHTDDWAGFLGDVVYDTDCDSHSTEYELSEGCNPLDSSSYPTGPAQCSAEAPAPLCTPAFPYPQWFIGVVTDTDCDGASIADEVINGCNPADASAHPGNAGSCTSPDDFVDICQPPEQYLYDLDCDRMSNDEEILNGCNPVDAESNHGHRGSCVFEP